MTVLKEKKAARGVGTKATEAPHSIETAGRKGLRSYLAVGVVAAAIGVGAVAGANTLGWLGGGDLSPSQIAEIRGTEFAGYAEAQYRAEIARIQEQRAQDMVEYHRRLWEGQTGS